MGIDESLLKGNDSSMEGKIKRGCPFFLKRDKYNICSAGMLPYVPSFFKVENYCKTDGYSECVIYGIESGHKKI